GPRPFAVSAVEPVRIGTQSGLAAVVDGPFLRPYAAQLVLRIEVVVDTNVELIAVVLIVRVAIRHVRSIDPAREADARGIEPVADGKVIRTRHIGQKGVLNKGIDSRPERVAGCSCRAVARGRWDHTVKDVEAQRSRGDAVEHRISVLIDCG